ncbi:MAG: DUF6850 family outer membrane beta-barrel protein [Gemmatimonadaceae bacterium]
MRDTVLEAQDAGRLSDSPWRWTWTPLRPLGGLGLPAPIPTITAHVLDLPSPVVGQSWSARNPAGLADDVREQYTRLTLAGHGIQGSYRLPTSPANSSSLLGEYGGWRRLGTRSAAIGRVAVERARQGDGNRSVFIAPDLSSPFVPTDTNAPATARTRVILEGGQGVQVGRWRLGLALGYDGTSDNANADRSTIALVRRSAVGAVGAGVSLALGTAGRVGVSARRISRNETVNIFANPGTARLYMLDGFVNVNPQDYVLEGTPFFRRADRRGFAFGIDASGTTWSTTWSAWADREESDERQIGAVATNTPVQSWSTSGYHAGTAAQRAFGDVLLSALATATIQRGVSVRAVATSRQFEADASRLTMVSDARWAQPRSKWGFAALLRADRQWQEATDRAARTATDITAWSPAGSVEVTRAVSDRWSYGADLSTGFYTPFATIPSINARGPSYLELLAPAFEVAAAPARTTAISFSTRWQRRNSALVMRIAWSGTTATRRVLDAVYLPKGNRGLWSLSISSDRL